MYSITSNIKLRFTIHMSKDGKYEAKIHVTREGESLESLFFLNNDKECTSRIHQN